MTQLYRLGDAYRAIQETDELTDDEVTTALANIKEAFAEKAGNIGKLMLSWKSDIKAYEEEIERLNQHKQAIANRVDKIKTYLAMEMASADITKVKNEVLSITLQNNPPSVQIDDEAQIPSEFWTIIPEQRVVDKKGILGAFKEQNIIPSGVTIITDKKHIVIR